MSSGNVTLLGALTVGSAGGCCGSGAGDIAFPLEACGTATASIYNKFDFNSPVTWIDLLAGSGITAAAYAAIKIRGGTNVELRITTPSAADQTFRLSDLWVYSSPVSGQQITALAVRGVGSIERMIAGS